MRCRSRAELRADFAREVTVGSDDARFDFHLLRLAIELAKQVVNNRQVLGISRMIKVLERSSAMMSPREDRNFFSVVTRSVALA